MKKFLIIAITGIILAAMIGVGWYFLRRGDSGEKGPASATSTPLEATAGEVKTEPEPVTDPAMIELLKKFADDQDYDGIKDEKEKELGTSLTEFDSDFDGLSDKLEIEKWKTDPLKKDTDGDGFGDGKEVLHGFNPLGAGKLVE
jgi:hypothetical protein